VSRFKIQYGSPQLARRVPRLIGGTFIVERNTGLVSVRLYRGRELYTLPLVTVAEFVVFKCIKAQLVDKARERKARRGRR